MLSNNTANIGADCLKEGSDKLSLAVEEAEVDENTHLMEFETFNFDESIVAGIQALGYSSPTPIQSKAIPSVI